MNRYDADRRMISRQVQSEFEPDLVRVFRELFAVACSTLKELTFSEVFDCPMVRETLCVDATR